MKAPKIKMVMNYTTADHFCNENNYMQKEHNEKNNSVENF